ncbi:MAG TPA: thioesterase domain-containing protein [Stellaceae bacterium]|nr:thioesterase domain-containing protein [Stellaceae bacterium]
MVARGAGAIVPLNAARAGIPFYCVHSIGGETTSFRDLAQRLGGAFPLYGIQAPQERLSKEFAASIERLSAHYVEELTLFQPKGELVLGGWSAGSVIALEMAQQLRARGREIAFLVLFDGDLCNTGGEVGARDLRCYWKWMCNLPRLIDDDLIKGRGWRSAARRIRAKWNAVRAKSAAHDEAPSRGHAVYGLVDTTGWPDRQVSFARALYDAIESYVPQSYGGRVLLYAAKTRPLSQLSPIESIWAKITPAVETVRIAGTHLTMLREPGVTALAGDLRKRLDPLCREDAASGGDAIGAAEAVGESFSPSGARRSRRGRGPARKDDSKIQHQGSREAGPPASGEEHAAGWPHGLASTNTKALECQ